MINRLRLIRNVGQFDSVAAGGQLPLARLTLLYAENGRGKTTLAAVLRSLASGDPLPITERRRLAANNPPHVILDCTGGPPPAIFDNGAWNRRLPQVTIFDDTFVDENVYSGLGVEPDHRQHLHELILGARGVSLNQELLRLVAKIEAHNAALRTKVAAIPTADRGSLTVDSFCGLQASAAIDDQIQAADRRLMAARAQEAIRDTPAFDRLGLPAFDIAAIERVLRADLPTLDTAAVVSLRTHLATLNQGAEAWIAEGVRLAPPPVEGQALGTCPFCEQDLAGSPVIDHYRAYFSDAYGDLKRTVADALAIVNHGHAGDEPATFERAVRVAGERKQFWSQFCAVPDSDIDTATIARDWRAAREAVTAALAAKQAAPLERMALSEEAHAALVAYEAHRLTVGALNLRLQDAGDAIRLVKEQAPTDDLTSLAAELERLRAIKARHDPVTASLCDDYLNEKAAKVDTERQRDEARAALDAYRAAAFPGYETAINRYLGRFNAEFRLDAVTATNSRGGPTCSYDIVINNTRVPVAGGAVAPGQPSFSNTLSAGDRNALALAFFFASLDLDPALTDRIVVIDDPLSSLDDHRSMTTILEIRRLATQAAQVIVLSHNKRFLCEIWDGADRATRTAAQISRDAAGSTITGWDVSVDSATEHDRRHAILRAYLANSTPDLGEVARSIRPALEGFLRVAFPEYFRAGTMLGPFAAQCRQTAGAPRPILGVADTDELDELIEYSNRFHHDDSNPAWQTPTINDAELRGFVARTLAFVTRPSA